MTPSTEGGGAHARDTLETAVEGREIIEAGRERNRRDRIPRAPQPHSRTMHARAQNELVRRHPDDLPKAAQEVVGAHSRLVGEKREGEALFRASLDPTQCARDAPLVLEGWGARRSPRIVEYPHDGARKAEDELLELLSIVAIPCGLGRCKQRQQAIQRRQARCRKACRPRPLDIGYEPFELVGGEPKGQTTVPGRVLVSAFERASMDAQEQSARSKNGCAPCRPILECPLGHRGNTEMAVPFLERAIRRTGLTDDVGHAPSGPRGQ
jgi:hypothetical protein